MKKQTITWIIIILVILVIFIALYFILRKPAAATPPPPVVNPNPTSNIISGVVTGLGGWLSNLFGGTGISGGSGHTTSNSGYTTIGNCTNGCDDGNPGYDCNGFLDTKCGG